MEGRQSDGNTASAADGRSESNTYMLQNRLTKNGTLMSTSMP